MNNVKSSRRFVNSSVTHASHIMSAMYSQYLRVIFSQHLRVIGTKFIDFVLRHRRTQVTIAMLTCLVISVLYLHSLRAVQ